MDEDLMSFQNKVIGVTQVPMKKVTKKSMVPLLGHLYCTIDCRMVAQSRAAEKSCLQVWQVPAFPVQFLVRT